MLGPLIALLSALTAGSLAYAFTSGLPLSANAYSRRLANVSGSGAGDTTWLKIGRRATQSKSLSRYLPIARLQADLPWAHLGGKWKKWQAEEIIGLSLAGAGIGLAMGLVAFEGGLLALAVAGMGFYIPILLVRSAANDMKRLFRRQLPEMVQVVAAEVGAGTSIETALARLADSPTVVGQVFTDLMARSRGKTLFSTDDHTEAALQTTAARWDVPELTNLIAQLNMVQRRGVYGAEVLSGLAKRTATVYLGERERKAEALETSLLMPLTLFFFVPFLAMVLGPIFVQLFSVL
jgi:tight adherence protein C